ncbi:unnamed protein product [Alternaria alternata]
MPAMMYINRRELGNTTSEKPLNAQQTGKTIVKYSNVWLEIIAYIWRTHELPVVTPSNSEEEVEGKRLLYRISAKQHMCIEKIKRIIYAAAAGAAIDWERLVDNGAETKVRWSFIEDPRNKHATSVEEPKQWLGQRLQDERKLREEFVDVEATRSALARGAGVVWAKDRVRAYGQAMKEARRKLAALVHMTGGAPPRGTELVSIKYRNSANGDSRGIFIEDGAVVFVTKYHKNVGQTGKGKVIH